MTTEHPHTWRSHFWRAMGSTLAFWLDTDDDGAFDAAAEAVETLFEKNEQALSRFRADSELSRLNEHSGQWVPVSRLLWDVLSLALEVAELTHGYFDPTMLNAVVAAGYDHSFSGPDFRPGQWTALDIPAAGQWSAIDMDEKERAIRLPSGVGLDLGGIAKGYTAQEAVELLRRWGPALVDAGGDLAAGAAPRGAPGWPVAISAPAAEPDVEPADLAALWLAEGGMATSGIDYRRWAHDGRPAHHLIDPFTGRPAESDVLTATVLAGNAAMAEALATATLVAGTAWGAEQLLDLDLAGLIVTRRGQMVATPAMHALLFPDG